MRSIRIVASCAVYLELVVLRCLHVCVDVAWSVSLRHAWCTRHCVLCVISVMLCVVRGLGVLLCRTRSMRRCVSCAVSVALRVVHGLCGGGCGSRRIKAFAHPSLIHGLIDCIVCFCAQLNCCSLLRALPASCVYLIHAVFLPPLIADKYRI